MWSRCVRRILSPSRCTNWREHRIGALVVENQWMKLVGIFSERDFVNAIAREGAAVLGFDVQQLMSSPVISCHSSDRIDAALLVMITLAKIRHLPVIDDGKLRGIISIGDLVKVSGSTRRSWRRTCCLICLACTAGGAQERPRGFDAKQYLPHRFEMCCARLDLLRQRMDVAEPAFERGTQENRIRAGRLVGIIRDRLGGLDGERTGQPHASPCRHIDHANVVRGVPNGGQCLHQIRMRRAQSRFHLRNARLHDGIVGKSTIVARRLARGQFHERIQHSPRDANRNSRDADSINALHRKSIEPTWQAPQRGIFARGAERLRHENVRQRVQNQTLCRACR